MADTVIFLGAGASSELKLPTTRGILPAILSRLRPGVTDPLFDGDTRRIAALSECLGALLPGYASIALDPPAGFDDRLPLVTDILSILDYHLLTGNAPSAKLDMTAVRQARTLVERAIVELLVRYDPSDDLELGEEIGEEVVAAWRETVGRILTSRSDEARTSATRIVEWLFELAETGRVTLISTNYDIEIEHEIFRRIRQDGPPHVVFEKVDFGTSVRDPNRDGILPRPADATFGVYKLHGSLNWLRCDLCDTIYVNPVGPITHLAFLLEGEPNGDWESWRRELFDKGANRCHCGHRPLRHLIVAPSFVRDIRDPVLLEIWRNALDALRRATTWYIVGYSLPPEDVAIRSMFLRAAAARLQPPAPKVVAIQREFKEPEVTRYRLFFANLEYFPRERDGGLGRYLARAR